MAHFKIEANSCRYLRRVTLTSVFLISSVVLVYGLFFQESRYVPPAMRPAKVKGQRTLSEAENNGGLVENESLVKEETNGEEEPRCKTFFTAMSTSFMDIHLKEDGSVPVLPFLESCRSIMSIFDKLHPSAFAPVKNDIGGNMRKIQTKYSTDTQRFTSLQLMILHEVESKAHGSSESATVALLWLKRGITFIKQFLKELLTTEAEVSDCATKAYGDTLRGYHGWVVRGVFALALKVTPYRKNLMETLAVDPEDAIRPDFTKIVMSDMESFVSAQEEILRILDDFYLAHHLESSELL